jgi:beta-N-acetylhexosaminidase
VIRFRKEFTQFPSALAMGREADAVAAVARQGAVEAQELARAGVHANLAPCVDVLAEGSDPIIGDRSYGADAGLVSRLAVARIRGLQSHGVAACAKHFPGLGAVPRDPHKTLPTVALAREEMERIHWAPFRAAIEAGVALVMSSHVCYPGLGEPPQRPATFSPTLIRDLLRRQLGFPGLILTDDLLMGAIRTRYGLGEAAVLAAEAGHDLLLVCDELPAQKEAFSALRQAYRDGRLPRSELEATAARLERFRNDFFS